MEGALGEIARRADGEKISLTVSLTDGGSFESQLLLREPRRAVGYSSVSGKLSAISSHS